MPEVFGILDELVKAGKLRHYGVSVEKIEEAIKAIEFPNVQSVADYLQHFQTAPGEIVFQGSTKEKKSESSRECRWRRECCRAKSRATASSRRRPSRVQPSRRRNLTAAKLFQAWILKRVCARGRIETARAKKCRARANGAALDSGISRRGRAPFPARNDGTSRGKHRGVQTCRRCPQPR